MDLPNEMGWVAPIERVKNTEELRKASGPKG